MRNKSITVLCLLLFQSFLHAGDNERAAIAARISTPPRIDGFINEEVWRRAQPISGFLQRDPNEGQPESEKTEIRVLFDHEALYFGCTMHDAEPDKIVARLTRRDNEIDSDAISLRLDTYHDHKTAFEFTVLASGVKVDILQYNDAEDEDDSWDVVWEVKTQILRGENSPTGWSAEIKIPFHALRYTPSAEGKNIWGVNFIRRISRKAERDQWAFVSKNARGFISHFGHLVLEGELPNPSRLEVLPYSVGRGAFINRALAQPATRTSDFSGDAGFDLKYGLSSNLTLDLTVNPDFGQVEADPAVLNLTTFETFYPEKRPFFIEGTQILQFSTFGGDFGPGLFYSRRIGRRPRGLDELPDNALVREAPSATTILGAAKITGKTNNGLALGILQAVTQEENANLVDAQNNSFKQVVEPAASYSLVRLKQDVMANSTIGMIATAVARDQRWPAYTGGVDWNLRFKESEYGLEGFLASSQTTQEVNRRITGSAGRLRFGKDGGRHWLYSVSGDFTSRHFNINDVGFFRRPDDYGSVLNLYYRENVPGKFFRFWVVGGSQHWRWNFDGAKLFTDNTLRAEALWRNYWETSLRLNYSVPAFDDRETRGLGLYKKPAQWRGSFSLETDGRKPLFAELDFTHVQDARAQRGWSTGLGLGLRPTTFSEIDFEMGYSRVRDDEAWVANLTDAKVSPEPISVFGLRDTEERDFTLRGNLTLTRDLTLQVYTQLFLAKGHHDSFRRVVTPERLVPYDYNALADFNEQAYNLNVVWRWEYRPGSVLYLVWTQARSGGHENYFTQLRDDARDAFRLPAQNVVLLKASYWWRR
jgi:hypothetical protein